MKAGVDAFWPDEGDWFNLFERIKRHQLYYQGQLSTEPNVRPWSLQRNGYPGIAQWGGWVWSGDTESSWKTLEAQIAVGLNYSLSIGPYWGSDIGGFYANSELTGELYARWYPVRGVLRIVPRARPHLVDAPAMGLGRERHGPARERQHQRPDSCRRSPQHPRIRDAQPRHRADRAGSTTSCATACCRTPTRSREKPRDSGLPLMRALWLHYPDDESARGLGDEFLWGRDLLIAPVFTKGATSRTVYLPKGDWYDWWTNARTAGGARVDARGGPRDDADLRPRRRHHPARSRPSVHEPAGGRADDAAGVYRGADNQYTLYDDDGISQEYLGQKGSWIRMTWNDRARQLTLEPGAPAGASNIVSERVFTVQVVPDGATKRVTYAGRRVRVGL